MDVSGYLSSHLICNPKWITPITRTEGPQTMSRGKPPFRHFLSRTRNAKSIAEGRDYYKHYKQDIHVNTRSPISSCLWWCAIEIIGGGCIVSLGPIPKPGSYFSVVYQAFLTMGKWWFVLITLLFISNYTQDTTWQHECLGTRLVHFLTFNWPNTIKRSWEEGVLKSCYQHKAHTWSSTVY